jgi:hypothetical protein
MSEVGFRAFSPDNRSHPSQWVESRLVPGSHNKVRDDSDGHYEKEQHLTGITLL